MSPERQASYQSFTALVHLLTSFLTKSPVRGGQDSWLLLVALALMSQVSIKDKKILEQNRLSYYGPSMGKLYGV